MELATKLFEGNDRTVLANRTEFLNFKKFSGLYKISFCLTRPDDQNTRLKNFVKRICKTSFLENILHGCPRQRAYFRFTVLIVCSEEHDEIK